MERCVERHYVSPSPQTWAFTRAGFPLGRFQHRDSLRSLPCHMHWVSCSDSGWRQLPFAPLHHGSRPQFIELNVPNLTRDREGRVATVRSSDWKSVFIHSSFMCLFIDMVNFSWVLGNLVHRCKKKNSRIKVNEVPSPTGIQSILLQETDMWTNVSQKASWHW